MEFAGVLTAPIKIALDNHVSPVQTDIAVSVNSTNAAYACCHTYWLMVFVCVQQDLLLLEISVKCARLAVKGVMLKAARSV